MKILVAYYSRTGLTKKVASSLSEKADATLDEIADTVDRSGAIGYMKAGRDAMKNKMTKILSSAKIKDYDMIIIGGPVWAWTVSPAIRTYVTENKDILKTKKLAFFATQGSAGADKKFAAMIDILGKTPLATMIINGKDFKGDEYKKKIDRFVQSF